MTELLLSIDSARAAIGGIGRTFFYQQVNAGHLELVKIGRRSFITTESLRAFVETQRLRVSGGGGR